MQATQNDLILQLVTKIDPSKCLRTEHNFQAFVKTLRILSEGTNRYLHLAHKFKTTKEDVDKLWNKVTRDDSNLYFSELCRLKEMVRNSIPKESYKELCREFHIYTTDDIRDFLKPGVEGLVEIFFRAISSRYDDDDSTNVITLLESETFTTFTWHKHMSLWLRKHHSNTAKFISETIQSVTIDMWYCEFEANHKVAKHEVKQIKHRFEQRNLIDDHIKLCKKLMPLIIERMKNEVNRFPQTPAGLFPIANGKVIDMTTLEIRDRKKEDYMVGTCDPLLYYEPNVEKCKFVEQYFYDLSDRDHNVKDYLIQKLAKGLAGIQDKQNIIILTDDPSGSESGRFVNILKRISSSPLSNWFLPSSLTKAGEINNIESLKASSRICCIDGFNGEHLDSTKVQSMSQTSPHLTWILAGGERSLTIPHEDKDLLKSVLNIFQNLEYDVLVDPTNIDHLSCVFSVFCRSLQKPPMTSSIPFRLSGYDEDKKKRFDFLSEFIRCCCYESNHVKVEHVTFHIQYRQWFKERHPNKPLPDAHQIKEEMLRKKFKTQGRTYLGIDVK